MVNRVDPRRDRGRRAVRATSAHTRHAQRPSPTPPQPADRPRSRPRHLLPPGGHQDPPHLPPDRLLTYAPASHAPPRTNTEHESSDPDKNRDHPPREAGVASPRGQAQLPRHYLQAPHCVPRILLRRCGNSSRLAAIEGGNIFDLRNKSVTPGGPGSR